MLPALGRKEEPMTVVAKNIKDIAPYAGPNAIPGIRFRAARQALGVTAWGMNVLELDAHCTGHPEHDHTADGQEEVYFVLEGKVTLRVGDKERALGTGDMVRVAPDVRRKLVTGDCGAVVLAIGGTPGKAFTPAL
jgi:mannose-6-phosphate isomerase-like protein (cupin superfamily)